MKISLHPELTEKVLTLTQEYSYAPEEIISMGIALASVLLKERSAGNQVIVVDGDGDRVGEFTEVEPKVIREVAEKYLDSVWEGLEEEGSASVLVSRLERERDAHRA